MYPRIEIRAGIDLDEKFCLAFDLHWCDGTPLLAMNVGPLYLNAGLEYPMEHNSRPVPPRAGREGGGG